VSFLVTLVSLAVAQQPGGRPGGLPGGPGEPPQIGQVLTRSLQERLKLTAEQKTKLSEIQKEVDGRFARLLTAEQKRSLQEMQGRFGGRGGPSSETARLDELKNQIGVTDEEWKPIESKLQKALALRKVLTSQASPADARLSRQPRAEGQPGRQPSGGEPPPGPGNRPPSSGSDGSSEANTIAQAQAEVRAALADPKHSKTDLQEKVSTVRKARQKARADLDAAQKDLLQLLTPEQEAILVGLGYLE
jgi:Spy/CpxP family protein refolding chaperone